MSVKSKTLSVAFPAGVMVKIKGDETPREAGQIIFRPGNASWWMMIEGHWVSLSRVSLHSLPNVKRVHPYQRRRTSITAFGL